MFDSYLTVVGLATENLRVYDQYKGNSYESY